MNHARLRSLFDEYMTRFPNELQAIRDDDSGNHFRVALNYIAAKYKSSENIDDNVWRFERAAVKSAVEEFVRTTGGNQ